MKSYSRLFLLIIVAFVLVDTSQAQVAPKVEVLNLTIKLKDNFNPDFKLCMTIETKELLEFSWTKGKFKTSVSVLLDEAKGEDYRLAFTIKENYEDRKVYSGEIKPNLKLDKPYDMTFIASSAFQNFYDQSLLLSKQPCK